MYQLAEGINSDVQSANIGIHSAWRTADDCTFQQRTIDKAII